MNFLPYQGHNTVYLSSKTCKYTGKNCLGRSWSHGLLPSIPPLDFQRRLVSIIQWPYVLVPTKQYPQNS